MELTQKAQDFANEVFEGAKRDGNPQVNQVLYICDWEWLIKLLASSEKAHLNLWWAETYLEDVSHLQWFTFSALQDLQSQLQWV